LDTTTLIIAAGLAVLTIAIVAIRRKGSGGELDSYYDPSDGDRYPHRWGYTDTRFVFDGPRSLKVTGNRYPLAGYSLPHLVPFVEEVLGVPIREEDIAEERPDPVAGEPNTNPGFLKALEAALPQDRISDDPKDRLIHSHGQLSVDEIYRVLYGGDLQKTVDLVVYPHSEEDVRTIVRLAGEHNVCLVPYGGGTNVSGALACPAEEGRMIVSVDMRPMARILWVDEENNQACVEAGIYGKVLERELDALGYTSGHDPDSVELSTLGGWISTNASGMKKNKYGNIEDIVLEATLVTPSGDLETRVLTPRHSSSVQPKGLLFGSEGNFGIITKAVIKIHPRPEVREYGSLVFRSFEKGAAYLKALRQTGVLPASIRLVNNFEFRFGQALKPAHGPLKRIKDGLQRFFLLKVLRFEPLEMVACTIVMEGSRDEVRHQKRTVFGTAKRFGAISGGAANGKRGYMLTFGIAYIRDFTNQFHILGETFETSVPWNRIHVITAAVRKELSDQCAERGVTGKPYLSYRLTQTYHTGVCIYFTMGFSGKGLDKPDQVYHDIESRLRQVILDNGGSLSHHHGIGKIRRKFLPQIQTETSIKVLQETKRAMDPGNIFGIRNGIFSDLS
jgi:alkyldihydroxyacetonephosphate synthase